MFCYRDMTFCPYSDCKKFDSCFRALTEKVLTTAKNADIPICQFVEQPNCFEVKK